ncbi:hypothetical protein JHN49_22330 [Streptomyces sp. MBT57]|nr:hypothetical protein [Streptomyces sp. MBT57]
MYAIREMLPDDQPAAERLWARRVDWARKRGIGPIHTAPLAAASAAPLPIVLTCDGTVVALATLSFPVDLGGADQTQGGEQNLYLERLVTDPDMPMPEAGSLSWIATTVISDVAARNGYDWVRMWVVPARLARLTAYLRTRLAWELDATVRRDGVTVHLLRRPAERSDAIRVLVPTRAMADVDRGMPPSVSLL